MPKRVDHEERRRRIAEAVWRVAALRGLEAASLREVAAEAGVSMGMVQHYFETKDQMILFACEYLVELAEQGARALASASPDPDAPRSVIRSVLLQTLPLEEERRAGTAVWFAFLARAARDKELAAFVRRAWAGTQDLVAGQIRAAWEKGDVSPGLDPEQEALKLISLADGLVAHLMVGHCSGQEALDILDNQLDRLFGENTDRV